MQLKPDQLFEFVVTVVHNQTEKILQEMRTDLIIGSFQKLMEAGIGVAYGVRDGDKPIGFLLGLHSYDTLNGVRKAFEHLFVVDPAHRAGGTAESLLHEFEEGARKANCETVVVGAHKAFKPDLLARWYKRKGFSFLSASYQKEL